MEIPEINSQFIAEHAMRLTPANAIGQPGGLIPCPVDVNPMSRFQDAIRIQKSMFAPLEKACLIWLARRMPLWVSPDHLTALGFVSQILAGAAYAMARWWRPSLLVGILFITLNWFGDSMDGALARARNKLRPRYGFYVDHISDTFGAFFLIAGLAVSGLVTERIAAGLLIGFLMLSVNSYLATYCLGVFRLSFWKFSPTEIRLLLMAGNIAAFCRPVVHVFGVERLLFDVGGVVAIGGMLFIMIPSAIRNTITLYQAEKI